MIDGFGRLILQGYSQLELFLGQSILQFRVILHHVHWPGTIKFQLEFKFFSWTMIKGKILVRCNLRDKGFLPGVVSESCVLCGSKEETVISPGVSMLVYQRCLGKFLVLMGCSWVLDGNMGNVVSEWLEIRL